MGECDIVAFATLIAGMLVGISLTYYLNREKLLSKEGLR